MLFSFCLLLVGLAKSTLKGTLVNKQPGSTFPKALCQLSLGTALLKTEVYAISFSNVGPQL